MFSLSRFGFDLFNLLTNVPMSLCPIASSLATFKIFSLLPSSSNNWTIMCLGVDLFDLSYLEFIHLLGWVDKCFSSNFSSFRLLFFLFFFLPLFFSPLRVNRASFMACSWCNHTGPHSLEGALHAWCLMLFSHCLEILNNCIFEFAV